MVEGPSMVELLVRMVFSLGLVLGLLVLCAKVARRNGRSLRLPGLGNIGGNRREPTIQVIERQSLTKNASLAVVQVGGRNLVVGITDHGVSLLADEGVAGQADEDGTDDAVDPDADRPVTDHTVTEIDFPREAKGTPPLVPGPAADAVTGPDRPPRMSFVDALRELTVRKAA